VSPRATGTRRRPAGGYSLGRLLVAPGHGFTLVEMASSVAVMLIVMSAAWLLLTTSNNNLNRIDYGSQASEANRSAFDRFERDLEHAVLPSGGTSAVLSAEQRSCSFMADVDSPADGLPELVTWAADGTKLVRSVQRANDLEQAELGYEHGFHHGPITSSTILTGLASAQDIGDQPMFTYARSATDSDWEGNPVPALVGLVTFRLRNGLPDKGQNVVDRTGTFRVVAFVINGY
jgi:prepilin-type N-terminal cleavage/methylation domain-containing protein